MKYYFIHDAAIQKNKCVPERPYVRPARNRILQHLSATPEIERVQLFSRAMKKRIRKPEPLI